MKFEDAIERCHIRSSIYRESNPQKRYARNHTVKLRDRVPMEDQAADDWKEYDPADEYPPYYGLA